MTINERVFEVLKEKKMSQTDLANALNVRAATISEWKRNRTTPSAATIGLVSKILNVSTDYLILGAESAATTVAINQGIFGDRNHNSTVTIHGNGTVEISEFEGELVKVCAGLDVRRKTALLSYAYELEKEHKGDQ